MKEYIKAIEEMRGTGKSRREISEKYGLTIKQIENHITRENRKKRKEEKGEIPNNQRGRKPAVTLAEYKYENKRLKMENELLRAFLCEMERGSRRE
jgi:transposase